ncbi:E3 ubiquitin-protein ligase RNF169 isoform X2 [Nothobranchius furzeri]|uniref:E3 ubiquitin-protein ligase RNF169 isoform X2 n=1 Tax=Nothobranchius furzeri TaxID=105023 RepID=UPI0024043F41|nr:E3 ubiquitin-protein ligase RNF169 isoform X2 [Nothobranchius furzeri]
MATAGFAKHPVSPTGTAAAGSSRLVSGAGAAGCRSGSKPPESTAKKCSGGAESQPGRSTACPPCLVRRLPGSEDRLQRKSDPERCSGKAGRRESECRREFFVCPTPLPKAAEASSGPTGKHKFVFRQLVSEDRDEVRRKNSLTCKEDSGPVEEAGVLSDSENEEPISRRIRTISAFIRKTKNFSTVGSGSQRSRSCTDPLEDRGGKMKVVIQSAAAMERVGISHSSAAGILLSSENSRSVSAPITAPDRRLTWRAVLTSSAPLGLTPARTERSISPESNDSISEELNHFKPIVCSPCTPPKRLPDGRLMEPTIVKSTPRNLTRGLQKTTSYEASPVVLQKWRQIELDRQSLKVNSKATLTSPTTEFCAKLDGSAKPHQQRAGQNLASSNKRRLLFEHPAADRDDFHKQLVKIRVPAVRYCREASLRGGSDFELADGTSGPCSGSVPLGLKHSFSPYVNDLGPLVLKGSQSPRRDGTHNQSTSRRGRKRDQKTKHLDPSTDLDLKRSRPSNQEAHCQVQQDRALALKLQKQFDLESRSHWTSPNRYFLRSWKSTQNRRRRGPRRSRRINKKH